MHGDPWTVAEIDLLVRVAMRGEDPSPADDPFEGLPGGSPMAAGEARADAELAGAIAAALAVGLIEPERAQELRALAEHVVSRRDAPAPLEHEPESEAAPPGVRAVLGGPTRWHDGARVEALECHRAGVRVRWGHRAPLPDDRSGLQPSVRLTDDVGTEYVSGGGSANVPYLSEGEQMRRGDQSFHPGIPAAARTLTVSIGGTLVELDVVGIGERPAV